MSKQRINENLLSNIEKTLCGIVARRTKGAFTAKLEAPSGGARQKTSVEKFDMPLYHT